VEDDTVWPFDPVRNAITEDGACAARHLARVLDRVGLGDRWAYRLADRAGAVWGLSARGLAELYRSADALLNVAGAVQLREEHLAVPVRVYVETDPVAPEIRFAAGDARTRAAFAAHHVLA